MVFSIEEWDHRYDVGNIPWELGVPREIVKQLFQSNYISPGCAVLEIGCGSGTNTFWIAEQGYQVTAFDISTAAIQLAKAEQAKRKTTIDFQVRDILQNNRVPHQFPVVFSCAVFNQMQTDWLRQNFVNAIAAWCLPAGYWLDVTCSKDEATAITQMTSTKAPPYLSASQIIHAVEPYFELIEMRRADFHIIREDSGKTRFNAWASIFKKRTCS